MSKKRKSVSSGAHKIKKTNDPFRQVTFTIKRGCIGLWRRALLVRYFAQLQTLDSIHITWQDQDAGGKNDLPCDLNSELSSLDPIALPPNESLALSKLTLFYDNKQELKITVYYTTFKVLVQGKSCVEWVDKEFKPLKATIEAIYEKRVGTEAAVSSIKAIPLPIQVASSDHTLSASFSALPLRQLGLSSVGSPEFHGASVSVSDSFGSPTTQQTLAPSQASFSVMSGSSADAASTTLVTDWLGATVTPGPSSDTPLLGSAAYTYPSSPLTNTSPSRPLTEAPPSSPLTETHPSSPQTVTHPSSPLTVTHPSSPLTETHPSSPLTETHPSRLVTVAASSSSSNTSSRPMIDTSTDTFSLPRYPTTHGFDCHLCCGHGRSPEFESVLSLKQKLSKFEDMFGNLQNEIKSLRVQCESLHAELNSIKVEHSSTSTVATVSTSIQTESLHFPEETLEFSVPVSNRFCPNDPSLNTERSLTTPEPSNSGKSSHAAGSPYGKLSNLKVFEKTTSLLIGDSVIKFINPKKLRSRDEFLQKICISGLTTKDLEIWLDNMPTKSDLQHVTIHVGVNNCSGGSVDQETWTRLVEKANRVFPSATLHMSGILPARGQNNLNNSIYPSNRNLAAVCKKGNVDFIDHQPSFQSSSHLYYDATHPNKNGTAVLGKAFRIAFSLLSDDTRNQTYGNHRNHQHQSWSFKNRQPNTRPSMNNPSSNNRFSFRRRTHQTPPFRIQRLQPRHQPFAKHQFAPPLFNRPTVAPYFDHKFSQPMYQHQNNSIMPHHAFRPNTLSFHPDSVLNSHNIDCFPPLPRHQNFDSPFLRKSDDFPPLPRNQNIHPLFLRESDGFPPLHRHQNIDSLF